MSPMKPNAGIGTTNRARELGARTGNDEPNADSIVAHTIAGLSVFPVDWQLSVEFRWACCDSRQQAGHKVFYQIHPSRTVFRIEQRSSTMNSNGARTPMTVETKSENMKSAKSRFLLAERLITLLTRGTRCLWNSWL